MRISRRAFVASAVTAALEFARGDLLSDVIQAVDDRLALFLSEQADFLQHCGMGHRAGDVMPPQPPVEGNGLREFHDIGANFTRKPATAGDWRSSLHRFLPHRICGSELQKSLPNASG